MAEFEYSQAEKIRDACRRHSVRYLFIGKSSALLLGFPDTTQGVDLFVDRTAENCSALVAALCDLGFSLSQTQARDIEQGKALIQIKNDVFDVNLVFAPDGIGRFEDAWKRHVEVEGFPVCHIDDVIASKAATHRRKDIESLPRLRAFREYWLREQEKRA